MDMEECKGKLAPRLVRMHVETVANLSLLIETEATVALLRSFSSLSGTSLALVAFSINEW